MSEENQALADEGIAALNETYSSGDTSPWQRVVEKWFDPEVVLDAGGSEAFTEGEWRGHDGAVGFVVNQMDAMDGMWMRHEEFIPIDPDTFVIGITFGGRAKHTGIPVELKPFHVFNLRGGRVTRWRIFLSREQALEAAGLSG